MMVASGVPYLLLTLLAAGGLRVETATPDALCPDPESVRAAVRARVGRIEGQGAPGAAGGAGEWLASYTIVHRPDGPGGDVVRLELFDPNNRPRLRRDLPRSDESCAAVAQAIAVVLDLYFRRPSSAPLDDGPGGAGTGDAAGGPEASTSATAAAAARGAGSGPTLGAFAGWAAGPSSPAVGVDLGIRLRSGWAAGIEGAWLTERQQEALAPGPGSVASRSFALRVHAGPRFAVAPAVQLGVGLEALLGLDHGTTPDLLAADPGLRPALGIGARGLASLLVAPWAALTVVVAGDFAPAAWAGRFTVQEAGTGGGDATREVFPPAALRLLARAGLDLLF